jgi:hypothetical protein
MRKHLQSRRGRHALLRDDEVDAPWVCSAYDHPADPLLELSPVSGVEYAEAIAGEGQRDHSAQQGVVVPDQDDR